jgi:hypothetical protein
MGIGIEDRVKISPPGWPARAAVAPGDLSKFAPVGLGMATPLVLRPWDKLEDLTARGDFYGANARTGDPFRDGPVNEAAGGTVYFDGDAESAGVASLLALLEVRTDLTRYALYAAESANPREDRYLAQIRIVDFGAMNLFGAVPGPGDEPWEQGLSVAQLIDAFIEAQRERWGRGMSLALSGTLGGDGDWAKEKLAFGFMVENSYNGVYRLWSRPWLVTK